jgi:crossover junction endodeoxyribonuclease RuvC
VIVIGLDLSLTRTGVAGHGWTAVIKPGDKRRGHERIQYLRDGIADYTRNADLVVIEGLAFDGHDTKRQNAGLSWMTRHDLWRRDVPYGTVPPSNLKQYVSGKGSAPKEQGRTLLAELLPWITERTTLDESDAAGLVLMGYDAAGQPIVTLPDKPNRAALRGAAWPASLTATESVRTGA